MTVPVDMTVEQQPLAEQGIGADSELSSPSGEMSPDLATSWDAAFGLTPSADVTTADPKPTESTAEPADEEPADEPALTPSGAPDEPAKLSRRQQREHENRERIEALEREVQSHRAAALEFERAARESRGTDEEYQALLERASQSYLPAEEQEKLDRWRTNRQMGRAWYDDAMRRADQVITERWGGVMSMLASTMEAAAKNSPGVDVDAVKTKPDLGEVLTHFYAAGAAEKERELRERITQLEHDNESLRQKSVGVARQPERGGRSAVPHDGARFDPQRPASSQFDDLIGGMITARK